MKIKPAPVILGILAVATALVYARLPDRALSILLVSKDYLLEMLSILPPVLVLCGLFDAWVPKPTIERLMGETSGIKGATVSILLGTVAMGPLYAAFPIGASLLRKGASRVNTAVFLCAWASIKVPMILFETKFLGAGFALLRLALTIPTILAISGLTRFAETRRPTHAQK